MKNDAVNITQPGFTGHMKDSETGLNPCIFRFANCTVQARYYDPVIGRFLSVDPVGFLDTGEPTYFNRYTYAANNPVNMVDPSGEPLASNSVATTFDRATVSLTMDQANTIINELVEKTNSANIPYSGSSIFGQNSNNFAEAATQALTGRSAVNTNGMALPGLSEGIPPPAVPTPNICNSCP